MTDSIAANRYRKQELLREIGPSGQEALKGSSVLIAGCGALGTHMADLLVRAGVGITRIVDRDFIEPDNLHRQCLYDEEDIRKGLPKAVAAAGKLRAMNSSVTVEGIVADITAENILSLMEGADLVMDGTDNFETRFLINDACFKRGIPWIYGGVVGTYGMTFPFVPGETPCFRCFMKEAPAPGEAPTCDTAGVLGTAVAVIASVQATEALKILRGGDGEQARRLLYADPWHGTWKFFDLKERRPDCPVCVQGRYEYLDRQRASAAVSLCGRNSVQVTPQTKSEGIISALAGRLSPLGPVEWNDYMLRFRTGGFEITVFPDGRAIINGTSDLKTARSLYARYIGA